MAIKLTVGHDEELKRKVLKDRMSKEAPPRGKEPVGLVRKGSAESGENEDGETGRLKNTESCTPGISKLFPTSSIWPTAGVCIARKLRMFL